MELIVDIVVALVIFSLLPFVLTFLGIAALWILSLIFGFLQKVASIFTYKSDPIKKAVLVVRK